MPPNFHRSHRLPSTSYQGTATHFLTLCFENRRTFAKNPAIANWLAEKLRHHAAAKDFSIHAYCVMPDHLHLLAEGTTPTSHLIQFIAAFKQQTAFEFKKRTSQNSGNSISTITSSVIPTTQNP
ncbi:MAG TPA: transposase [Candidatus Dormibacteraeota bacterium]|nr:transposase [Candidatus Dormibacteraeota bacterium]